ncbi:MAG: CpaF family protein [Bdellovibrionaceae bacterium]|nr:CpaF family protein [Pseudobdellovibrionaceae bacterium]
MKLDHIVDQITDAISQKNNLHSPHMGNTQKMDQTAIIKEQTQDLSSSLQQRVHHEFFQAGPLEPLLTDELITEIIVNSPESIWFEKSGQFYKHSDFFLSRITYNNFIHLLADQAGVQTNYKFPFANGEWRGFRVHLASPPSAAEHTLTLRRLRPSALHLSELYAKSWCNSQQLEQIKKLVQTRQNILVVGTTGSGKTTLLNSLVQEALPDRCVFIEDTPELVQSHDLSVRLLTRADASGALPPIEQSDLVKQSLRMRPDRLIVGEIRGAEAKDLLLALSTGHRGSMASLHADNANEALLRLEMLVLMGAPQWDLLTIRRLIQYSIHAIIITRKDNDSWKLDGLYRIASLESFGFIVSEL